MSQARREPVSAMFLSVPWLRNKKDRSAVGEVEQCNASLENNHTRVAGADCNLHGKGYLSPLTRLFQDRGRIAAAFVLELQRTCSEFARI